MNTVPCPEDGAASPPHPVVLFSLLCNLCKLTSVYLWVLMGPCPLLHFVWPRHHFYNFNLHPPNLRLIDMNFPSSPELDLFVEDDNFEPGLNFELDAESSMWMDDSSSSSCVDESQDFINIDSDFDLLEETKPPPLVDNSDSPFKMELDLETESTSLSDGSDSGMSVDSEFDMFSPSSLLKQRKLIFID